MKGCCAAHGWPFTANDKKGSPSLALLLLSFIEAKISEDYNLQLI